jgi:6,7-dimethyl-8-ribityllumazine synthase
MATHQRSITDEYIQLEKECFDDKRFLVITADWNKEITENLTRGCIETLAFKGVSAVNIHELHVPGAVELVYAAAKNLDSKRFDAIIVIGCVIRGETAHFDYVCKSVTDGVTELNLRAQLPVIFCVLTDDTLEQSRARSGGALGNKGEEAALAALRMAML